MSFGKVLLGVLAGVSAGAVLGILFAPDKGTSTRSKISQKGDEYADGLEEKFNEFINNVSKKYKTVVEDASHLTGKAGDMAMETEATVVKAAK